MTLDLTKYTIIKASAGSGKTYRLTQELANRLANGESSAQLHPSQIIATTFTRKAAQELKHRIREYLVDENQLSQAAALPAALIGTVNSVTGRILQDFAVDIGLSPDLTVLTETAERRAFAIAADDIIAAAEQEHRGLLARTGYNLTDADWTSFHDLRRNWSDTIRNVVNLARTNDIDPSEFAGFAEQTVEELTPLVGTYPACRALGVAPATIYRRRRPPEPRPPKPRPKPARALAVQEREAVLEVLHSERFLDCSPAAAERALHRRRCQR